MSEAKNTAMWSGAKSRQIVERIVIEGTLVLETPAHFGGGESDGTTMTLLVDTLDETRPLLTGASIAGALRSYLWTRERGYENEQSDRGREVSAAALLFGTSRKDDRGEGDQSRLIVDDAVGKASEVVYRDGVRLNPESRTADDNALYAVQLWDKGTTFSLRFELLVSEEDAKHRDHLLLALATALDGLAKGEITFGARKNRGYGRVRVDGWRVRVYKLSELDGLMAWLREGGEPLPASYHVDVEKLAMALGVNVDFGDARELFTLDASFTLDGSLLIRSADDLTDMRQLSNRAGDPILSGTSIAGALRARAEKILNTLASSMTDRQDIITDLFGSPHDQKKNRRASRVTVEEHLIKGGVTDLVQSRVSIDRFTGGALDTALFDQQPVFGSAKAGVQLRLQVRKPTEAEIGLLLLLLKDLWTGDLPLGGERSVGRGRLRGQRAKLTYGEHNTWTLQADGDGLNIEPDRESLNDYLQALLNQLKVAI